MELFVTVYLPYFFTHFSCLTKTKSFHGIIPWNVALPIDLTKVAIGPAMIWMINLDGLRP
jgi:hypothetical protein